MQRLDKSDSAKPYNAILSGQCREVICYEVKSHESDLLPFTYTPLWLIDGLKREKPLNNQLQPLTSKIDKKLLKIFCFVGANIEFFAWEMS